MMPNKPLFFAALVATLAMNGPVLAGCCSDLDSSPSNSSADKKEKRKTPKNMVFVEGGTFLRGSDPDGIQKGLKLCRQTYYKPLECNADWFKREGPQQELTIDPFYIDKYEVTNAQYRKCVKAGDCPKQNYKKCSLYDPIAAKWVDGGKPEEHIKKSNHPAVCVSWWNARDYCKWANKRLPTDAEWEKAARGDMDAREYPWGDFWEPTLANTGEVNGLGVQDGWMTTAPVGKFKDGKSPYGAYDMAGNVWEWTADYFEDAYYMHAPQKNPRNKTKTNERSMRGGAWSFAGNGARVPYRYFAPPSSYRDSVGMRCAKDAD
jgi:formylglycine-generating enzyme required for sulfatase activity